MYIYQEMGIYYPEINCGITEFIYVFYIFSLDTFNFNIVIKKGDYIQLGPNPGPFSLTTNAVS